MAPERVSALAPFKNGTFRAIWLANITSSFGGLIQSVGAAWLMTSLTDAVDLIALVQTATVLPIMLLSLVGGAVADNFPRRRVMLVAQLFMLIVSVGLALLTWVGAVTPWLILGFTFLVGCGTAINNPSWHASVGDMVPRSEIHRAVALNSIGFNLSRSLGPAIGGAIVATLGAAVAFAVNATSYIAMIVVLLRWRPTANPSPLPRETVAAAMRAGVRYVAMSPQILRILARSFLFGLSASSILALLPVVARNVVDGGPLVFGLLLGAFGMGAVGGALFSSRIADRMSTEWIVRLTFCGFATAAFVSAVSPSPWLTGVATALAGACWTGTLSLFNVTVQLSTPRWVVGRALSVYQTVTFGGMALGSWMWGVLGEEWGVQVSLTCSGIALLGGALIGLWLKLPPRLLLDLDPTNRWQEPQIGMPIERRSGPIVIEIEFRVRPEDVPEFLRAMADRKRVKRRDGARDWRLRRDLHDPDIWSETYQMPTWLDYIRLHHRRTVQDEEITERLHRVHAGDGPPKVRRLIERPPNWITAVAQSGTIDPH